jgi:hypothetical protein
MVLRVALFFLLLFAWPAAAEAQYFQCPAGSVQVSGGGGIMCQCPDGSYASMSGCPSYRAGQSSDSCAELQREKQLLVQQWEAARRNFAGNPYGGAESNWQANLARLQQLNAEIANCQAAGAPAPTPAPQQQTQFPVNCGSYSCRAGSYCGSNNSCLTDGTNDCGSGKSCPGDKKCAKNGTACLATDTIDCGSFFCGAGHKCGTGNQCIARDAVDCGGGRSCIAGSVCTRDGSCITKEQLAQRVEDEKKQKAAAKPNAGETSTANAQKGRKVAKQCATAIEIIDSFAVGRPLNLPECESNTNVTAAPSAPAPQSPPPSGVTLNPNLKDISTLSPPAAQAQQPPTTPTPPNQAVGCSTFANPTPCPKAGPPLLGPAINGAASASDQKKAVETKDESPFTRQPTPQELAKSVADQKAQSSSAPTYHEVTVSSDDCGIVTYGPRTAECALQGGGVYCTRTTTTKSCEKGWIFRDVNCTKPIITTQAFCKN